MKSIILTFLLVLTFGCAQKTSRIDSRLPAASYEIEYELAKDIKLTKVEEDLWAYKTGSTISNAARLMASVPLIFMKKSNEQANTISENCNISINSKQDNNILTKDDVLGKNYLTIEHYKTSNIVRIYFDMKNEIKVECQFDYPKNSSIKGWSTKLQQHLKNTININFLKAEEEISVQEIDN